MAKKGNKKSNTKNLIMSVVALVGALIAGVGLFLNVWTSYMKSEYGYADASVKLFNEDLANCDAAFCARVFEVLAIVVVIAIIASVVLSLVTNKASMITTILNIVALAAIVVAVVCACIFFIANHSVELGTTIAMKGAVGFYMIAIGGIVGSVAAFLASRK